MRGSFAAEFYKLRKRPAVWLLGVILMAYVVGLGYALEYQSIVNQRSSDVQGDLPGSTGAAAAFQSLLPENLIPTILFAFVGGVGALTLIMGVLAVGSEYGWGTLKTMLSRKPGRFKVFSGKIIAVGVMIAGFTFAAFALGAVSSFAVATVEGAPVDWPPLRDLARGLVTGWLVLAAYGALGVFLATLFRGTSLAIGFGLVYALIVENILLGIQASNGVLQAIQGVVLSKIASNLSLSFQAASSRVNATQDTLVLVAYITVLVLLSICLFRMRDIV